MSTLVIVVPLLACPVIPPVLVVVPVIVLPSLRCSVYVNGCRLPAALTSVIFIPSGIAMVARTFFSVYGAIPKEMFWFRLWLFVLSMYVTGLLSSYVSGPTVKVRAEDSGVSLFPKFLPTM